MTTAELTAEGGRTGSGLERRYGCFFSRHDFPPSEHNVLFNLGGD